MAHHTLRNHRKLKRLVRGLSISVPTAIGHLELLWQSAYANPRIDSDGLLKGWSEEDIAGVAEWSGDPANFAKALVAAGFLEESGEGYVIHDYEHWVPNYVSQRWRNRRNARTSGSNRSCTPMDTSCQQMETCDQKLDENGEIVASKQGNERQRNHTKSRSPRRGSEFPESAGLATTPLLPAEPASLSCTGRAQRRAEVDGRPVASAEAGKWTRERAPPDKQPSCTVYALAVEAEEILGEPFSPDWARDGKAIKKHLSLGIEEIKKRWRSFMDASRRDEFLAKNRNIPFFVSRINASWNQPPTASATPARVRPRNGEYRDVQTHSAD